MGKHSMAASLNPPWQWEIPQPQTTVNAGQEKPGSGEWDLIIPQTAKLLLNNPNQWQLMIDSNFMVTICPTNRFVKQGCFFALLLGNS